VVVIFPYKIPELFILCLNIMSGISKQVCDLPERYVLMIIVLMVSSGIGYVDIFFFGYYTICL
jgi:hypothetical protein